MTVAPSNLAEALGWSDLVADKQAMDVRHAVLAAPLETYWSSVMRERDRLVGCWAAAMLERMQSEAWPVP